MPEHRIPEVGARIMDLQDPTRKMSTTNASEQGTVYVLDEPAAIAKKFKLGGHRLRQRRAARRGQAGRLEPDRDPRGGARAERPGGRSASSPTARYGDSRRRWRRR